MEDLQVPTHEITVKVHTDTGDHIHGSLFVAGMPFQTGRPEEVARVLNDERMFLPFHAEPRHEFSILNKAHIRRVSVQRSPLAEGQPDGSPYEDVAFVGETTRCRVLLEDGTRLDGEVLVDTPRSMSRLIDKLNCAERFLQVVTEDSVEFVHADHVVCVG